MTSAWSSHRASDPCCHTERWLGLQVTCPTTTRGHKHTRKRVLFRQNPRNILACVLFCLVSLNPTVFQKDKKNPDSFTCKNTAPLSVWWLVPPTTRRVASSCSFWLPASVAWRLHLIFHFLDTFYSSACWWKPKVVIQNLLPLFSSQTKVNNMSISKLVSLFPGAS